MSAMQKVPSNPYPYLGENFPVMAISELNLDPKLYPRKQISLDVIKEYAEQMNDGADFPPVKVAMVGNDVYVIDGRHILEAWKSLNSPTIPYEYIEVKDLSDLKARLAGANRDHGLQRTNEDKRIAVTLLLEDPTWVLQPNEELSRMAGVSAPTIKAWREKIPGANVTHKIAKTPHGGTRLIPSTNAPGPEKKAAPITEQTVANLKSHSADLTKAAIQQEIKIDVSMIQSLINMAQMRIHFLARNPDNPLIKKIVMDLSSDLQTQCLGRMAGLRDYPEVDNPMREMGKRGVV